MPDQNTSKIGLSPQQVEHYCKKAKQDAGNDPAGAEGCKAWDNSLQQIADEVAGQMNDKFLQFKDKCEQSLQKISDLRGEINQFGTPGYVANVAVSAQQASANAAGQILIGLKARVKRMTRFRERFPNLGNLGKAAHAPNKAFFVGFVIFLIAVESFANSRLFAEADDFGLVGGALLAVIVSCINVLPMILIGILATKARGSLNIPVLVWRGICLLAFVWAALINVAILVLRNNKIAEAGGSADTSHGAILFIVGIVIAGIAFWEGFRFADLYAKVRECQEEIDNDKKNYSEQILYPIEDAMNKAQATRNNIKKEMGQLNLNFTHWNANFPLIAIQGIVEVKRVWKKYHGVYAPLHMSPNPTLPDINTETAEQWDVHIRQQWCNYAKNSEELAKGHDEWLDGKIQKIEDLRSELIDLRKKYVGIIIANIGNIIY